MAGHTKKRFFWGVLIVLTAFICGLLDYNTSNAMAFGRTGIVKERISATTTAEDLKAMQNRFKEQGITFVVKEVKYTAEKTVSSISISVDDNAGRSGGYSSKDMSKMGYFDIVFDLEHHTMALGKEK